MNEHKSPISGIATFGEQWVATAGYDNQVILWDARTKTAVARGWHDHLANQVSFSPCGSYLVTSSSDHTARLWSVPTMKLQAVCAKHSDDVESVSFHPTKPLIATACRDHEARIFDFTGKLIKTLSGHGQDVISVEWSQSGDEILTSSDDGTVKRWDSNTGLLLENIDLGGVETDTIVISASGNVYAGNDEGEVILIRDGIMTKIEAHNAGVKRLVYSAQAGALVSLSYDRQARIFKIDTSGELVPITSTTMPSIVWPRSCAFLGTKRMVFATFGSSYAILELDTMTWITESIQPTFGLNALCPVGSKRFSIGDAGILWMDHEEHKIFGSLCNFLCPMGDLLITGGQLGTIFESKNGTAVSQHRSPLNCAAGYVRNGCDYALVGTYTGEAILLIREAGLLPRVQGVYKLHENAIKGLAINGDVVFSVCATGAAAFHRITDFTLLYRSDNAHDKIANGCTALSPGYFASVSRDMTLRIWNGFTSETIVTPHDHSIKCVAASPCGRFIATGSYNGMVGVFDLETRTWIKTLRISMAGISSLTYDEKNHIFLAASYDGNIYEV